MAASLGRLTLDLVTRISSFTEPLERAERQAEDSTKKITKSFDAASFAVKALGAAAAGLSVASVMAFAEKFVDAGNDIQKFSKLSNASIQQFQYYAVGANTAGISMESFADKMKDMQDRIGDFQRTGGGPLADFFNDIAPRVGVTIDQFQKLSGPEALQLFYDSLQKAGASTNDMKFYMESIISDSSLLIPLLENGGKGFQKWGNAAQQAGSILSDDMVKNLALAKENLQILDLQWQGFEAELVNVAVPALKEVVTHMDEVKAVATVLGAYLVGAGTASAAKYVAGIYSKITALVADRQAEEAAILTAQRKATAELNAANAQMSAARAAVANAEEKVAADRHVIASEIQRIESSIAQTNAEKALEAQRLRSQITDQGRNATLTRMAELQRVQASMTAELTVLEQRLASTTVAGSAEYVAARTAQTAATERLTVATSANNVAQAASVRTGAGLLGLLGGPVGLGLTVAAVAASYLLLKDSSKDTAQVLDTQGKKIDELLPKWKELNAVQRDTAIHQLTQQVDELGKKYTFAYSELDAYIGYLEDSGRISENVAQQIQNQFKQYSQGKITADQFYSAVKSINGVSEEQVTKIRNLVSASDGAKSAYQQQKDVLNQLNQKNEEAAKKQQQHADATNNAAAAYALLTQKQMEYVRGVEKTLARQKYIENQVKNNGMSVEMANHFADSREAAGLGFSSSKKDVMPAAVRQATIKSFDAKNYTFTKDDLAAIAKVNGIAAKNNFAQIESLYGLPKGTLAAYVLGESGGNANAVSQTGAYGLFQTTGIFRKQYGLSKNSPIEKQATAVADALAKGIEEFGNLPDALRSLNAGISGTKQYLAGNIGTGKGQMSPAKAKEVAGYAPKFAKNFAGVNGQSTIDQSILMPTQADLLAQQATLAEAQKALDDKKLEINKKYYTQEQQLAQDNTDAIEAINSTLTGSAQTNALAKQAALYQSQLTTLHAQEKEEYNQLHAFETDRITQLKNEYAVKKQLVDADLSKKQPEKDADKATLDRQMQAEIDAIKREEAQQILSAKQVSMDSIEFMKQQYALERDEIVKNKGLSDKAREQILAGKDAEFQQQIDAIKREESQQVMSAFEAYMNETEIVVKRYAIERDEIQKNYKLTEATRAKLLQANAMGLFGIQNSSSDKVYQYQRYSQEYLLQRNSPNSYAAYDLQNQYSSNLASLNQAYANQKSGIENDPLANQQQIEQSLLDAHEQYLKSKNAMDEEYALKQKDLLNAQFQNQLDSLNTLVSSTSSSWSSMTSIVKDQAGEQSGVYKAMFAVQQAFAITSATINAFQAYSQIMASPWYLDIVSKETAASLALGMGMANVGMIAAQTISGFSEGGYTGAGGKYETAGIVHKGEVVFSQDDIARLGGVGNVESIRKNGISGYADGGVVGGSVQNRISSQLSDTSSGGDVNIEVNVTDSGTSTTGASTESQKQLGNMIGNTVRSIILQEKRQGGLLAK